MKKRIFSLLLAANMLVSLLPVTALATDAVSYISYTAAENGKLTKNELECEDYETVNTNTTALGNNGWYVADGTVTVTSRLVVTGTANLVLKDGAKLTAKNGIGVDAENTLNIYAQANGSGQLIAEVTDINSCAGIGGTFTSEIGATEIGHDGGTINIYGGVVTAKGVNAAGIGGSYVTSGSGGNGGTVTIYSGTVTATGGTDCAGIGGGCSSNANYGHGGELTVYGGTVVAIGTTAGAGIGGGWQGNGGTVKIYGGSVTATGGTGSLGIAAAGIGGGGKAFGGFNCNGGDVTIYGGTVIATGGTGAAGIGGGGGGNGGTVTINGGTVTATGGTTGAGIGKGGTYASSDGSLTVKEGVICKAGDAANSATECAANVALGKIYFHSELPYNPATLNSAPVAAANLTYDGNEHALLQSGGTATNGTMMYSLDNTNWDDDIPVGEDAGEYTVYYMVKGDDSHDDLTDDNYKLTVTIGKANYTGFTTTVSANLKATSGSTVEITLPEIPDGASYGAVTNNNGTLYTVGTINQTTGKVTVTSAKDWDKTQDGTNARSFTVAVTPSDSNYNSYTITVGVEPVYHTHSFSYAASGATVTATCVNTETDCDLTEPLILTLAAEDDIYDGNAYTGASHNDSTVKFSLTTGATVGNIKYYKNGEVLETAPVDAGSYTAKLTVTYGVSQTVTAEKAFQINKASPTADQFAFTAPESILLTYDGNGKAATVAAKTGVIGMGTVTVKYAKKTGEATWDTATDAAPTDAGTYKVSISVAEGDNYAATDSDLSTDGWTFTITKATSSVTAPTAIENLIYTGQPQTLVTEPASATIIEGTLKYKLGTENAAGDGDWSENVPTGIDAGDYYVWYKVVGDGNHNDTTPAKVKASIAKKEITINWAEGDFTYNKTEQTESITANYKDVNETSHTLVVAVKQNDTVTAFMNAGTYTAGVTGFAEADSGSKNYALPETVVKSYTMKQKPVTVLDVTVADKTYSEEGNTVEFTGAAIFDGLCGGDTLTLSGVTGTYASQNAGSQKVTFTNAAANWTLSNANYKLAEGGHATYTFGKIMKKNQNAPTAPAVSGSIVTINENDREKKLEYSLYSESAWIGVPTLNGGAFTLSGLAIGDHTIYLRVKESGNYNASPSVSTDFTLTQFSVAYNANGGVGNIASQTADSGSSVTVASGSAMSRTGYTFSGWNTAANGDGTFYTAGASISSGATLYAQWTPKTYIVKFHANGGTGTMENEEFTYGTAGNLTAAAFTRADYTFAGWAASANGPALYSDKQEVKNLAGSGTVTLYAVWVQNAYSIRVDITSPQSGDVQIKLQQGNAVYAVQNNVGMSENGNKYTGHHEFVGVPAGTYDIVAKQTIDDDKSVTMTQLVVLEADSTADIVLPESGVNSKLEVEKDTLPTVVGGLDEEAESNRQGGKNITVTMTVEKQEEQQLAATASEKDKATQDAISEIKVTANGKVLDFMNIEIEKETKDSSSGELISKEAITATSSVLELVFSYKMDGKKNIQIYRQHGDAVHIFEKLDEKPVAPYTDGKFYVDTASSLIYIYASSFSTYAIGYEQEQSEYHGGVRNNYAITVNDAKNGTVSTDRSFAFADSIVTITVVPDTGFTLETLTVLDKNGKKVEVENLGNNKFSFKMPSREVTVSATFMEDNTMLDLFVDVNTADYFYDAVLWAAENDITKGTDAVHFAPNIGTTRAQVVTFLWRAAGCPEPIGNASKFTDVVIDSYYEKAVAWAIEQVVTKGTTETTFSPDVVCTRAHIVTFLARFAGVADEATGYKHNFTDVKATDYFNNAVAWAKDNKVTEGSTPTTFRPNDDCTRAQIVTFLYRWMVR